MRARRIHALDLLTHGFFRAPTSTCRVRQGGNAHQNNAQDQQATRIARCLQVVGKVRAEGAGILQEMQQGDGVCAGESRGENPRNTSGKEAQSRNPRSQGRTLECFKKRDDRNESDGQFRDCQPVDDAGRCRVAFGQGHSGTRVGDEVPGDGQGKDSQDEGEEVRTGA